ncbi:MAG TPA: hypothetical protein VGJ94_12735 [Syntrophorhabdaceae bacterium]
MGKVRKYSVWAGPVILACVLFLAPSTKLFAEGGTAAPVNYNVGVSLKDNLTSFAGKDIYVSLRSGKVYQGYVKSVGDAFLHLEKIAGKDFYDALIRLDDISAVEAKFRGFK